MPSERLLTNAASSVIAAIGGLHLAWGLGSSFPFTSREALFENVAGDSGAAPGALACFAVAGCLATSAAAVAGRPRSLPRLRRAAAATTTAALGGRALMGFTVHANLVTPSGRVSEQFRSKDLRFYSPLCLLLALAATPAWRNSGVHD